MELMTIQEAADALRVAPVTIRRYIRSGRLRAVKVGRGVRIDKSEVESLPEPSSSSSSSEFDWVPPSGRKYIKYLKGPMQPDDPFWGIIGSGEGDPGQNVSGDKYKYLADAKLGPE
jgi:excisionase family DNA binding protein